jgi:hypothetical protein
MEDHAPVVDFDNGSLSGRLRVEDFEDRLSYLSTVSRAGREKEHQEAFERASKVDAQAYGRLYEAAYAAYDDALYQTRGELFNVVSLCFALDGGNNTYTWRTFPAGSARTCRGGPALAVYVTVGLNKELRSGPDVSWDLEDQDCTTLLLQKEALPEDDKRYSSGDRWLYTMAITGTRYGGRWNRNERKRFAEGGWFSPHDMLTDEDEETVQALLYHAFTEVRNDDDGVTDDEKYCLGPDVFSECAPEGQRGEDLESGLIKFGREFCARLVCSSLIFNDENKRKAENPTAPRMRVYDIAC